MSLKHKIAHEARALAFTTLFFASWVGALLLIKKLVLAEYDIRFGGLSAALLGVLVLAKVVLILERAPLGSITRSRPVWVEVLLRTALYSLGVAAVLVLERTIHGVRHGEAPFAALREAVKPGDANHLAANLVCIAGALLAFN